MSCADIAAANALVLNHFEMAVVPFFLLAGAVSVVA